jgi:hypothetical protein
MLKIITDMKKAISIFIFAILMLLPLKAHLSRNTNDFSGYILLQTEKNGEAWYVYPQTGKRYFLGRPDDAFLLMKKFALGAHTDYISKTDVFPDRLSGIMLIDIDKNGETYYIYPKNKHKYFLARPKDAFRIMSELGQGISNTGLINIPEGDAKKKETMIPITGKILLDVPFTSQAPFGDWKDQRQEDGCEESSSLMAVKWARGQSLDKAAALKEITGISDFILKKYGESRDISPQNTIDWIFKDYFGYPNAVVKKDITIADIVNELAKGNLVLTPMNGQLLHNPNFVQPGPPRHMVVIRGYDPDRKVFITNDPGTRNGKLYEYGTQVLFEAIREYPTGYHEPIDKINKTMIVVWK